MTTWLESYSNMLLVTWILRDIPFPNWFRLRIKYLDQELDALNPSPGQKIF